MRLSNEVLQALENANCVGRNLYLGPPGSLERKLYIEVNRALEAMGGKWTKSVKAHVFDDEAGPILAQLLDSGEYTRAKQDLGQFDTPPSVVARLMELAAIQPNELVLEPQAGIGNLVLAAEAAGASVAGVEVDAKRLQVAKDRCQLVLGIKLSDFTSMEPTPIFDVVLMNPPFAGQADIDHVLHASKFLKPGGRLVSVMSNSVTFRNNRKTADFRAWVESRGGLVESLPEGAFALSGTMVRACIVAINRATAVV